MIYGADRNEANPIPTHMHGVGEANIWRFQFMRGRIWRKSTGQSTSGIRGNHPRMTPRRLDCPAFRRALETGQTKRRIRQSLYGPHSTGFSKTFRLLRVRERIFVTLPLRLLRFQKSPFSAMGPFNADENITLKIRLFDWPACFQVFSNRPDKSPHQTEPIRRRIQRRFETMLTPRTVAPAPQPPRSVRTGFKRPLDATGYSQ